MGKKKSEKYIHHQKVVEQTKAALLSKIGGTVSPPTEYVEFRLCRILHCLPHELDDLDEDMFHLYLEFAAIEAESDRIRGNIPS